MTRLMLKENPNRRQYKLQLNDGRMISLKRQIHSPEQLEKVIAKYKDVKNVYESCAEWLNPVNIHGNLNKGGYRPILLNNLVFIDLDDSDFAQVQKVLKWFKNNKNYRLWQIVHSSPKGYHVIYEDLSKSHLKAHPYKRIQAIKGKRKRLERALLKAGIKLDHGILTDVWRVSRVIGSINGNKKGFICHNHLADDTPESEECNSLSDDRGVVKSHTPHHINRTNAESGVRRGSFKLISNAVYGVKNCFVPYVELDKKGDVREKINKISNTYNLGTGYLFEDSKKYMVLFLKLCDRRRIEKIMKAFNALNLNQFLRHGFTYVKCSSTIYEDSVDELKLIGKMPNHNQGWFSRPHKLFLESKGVTVDGNNFAGTENKIFTVINEERNLAVKT